MESPWLLFVQADKKKEKVTADYKYREFCSLRKTMHGEPELSAVSFLT
jgi:hypothetical protein